ncbi:MAG TPA: ABC transporter substrate-binding protein [Candidatus Binatia bacterium]|jgi:ABC-type nitrate/sulfonate/bicarbonate transport system substrate-binding protein
MPDRLLINVFNVDAALAAGRAKGIFAAHGLEVDVKVTPNSTEQMRGLGKGSWQIVSTAFDNVLGWAGREGAEIVAVAQVSAGNTLPVYVRPEIKTWDDLRGKALAVDAVDTAYALVLRRVLLAHGLAMDRGDYTLIPKGTTGYRLESMAQGETFAGVLNPPWDQKAEAAGMKRFADHREVLPDYPGGVYAVNRMWASENRAVLSTYFRAWNQALRWAQDEKNRDEAIRVLAEAEKIDAKAAANRLRQSPKDGRLNLPGLATVLALRVQFGLIPAMGEDLPKYYDESFYRETSND